jgi:hypothetical protein
MDFDLLCSQFLENQDWASRLRDVCYWVGKYKADYHPPGAGSRRRADLNAAARHGHGLANTLAKIDLMLLAQVMGPLRGEPITLSPTATAFGETQDAPAEVADAGAVYHSFVPLYQSFVPLRLAELERFMATLNSVSKALDVMADTVPVARKRPPLPDPILFGIQALRALWLEAHGKPPKYSFNKQQFGHFALEVLGPNGVGIEEPAIRTAVRKVLIGRNFNEPETVPD